MLNTVRILSIDGGGIRGIIPAMVLAEIERRTGQPTCQLFDLISGTSTGGILALALTKPKSGKPEYTAEQLIGLYQNEGVNIFSRSFWRKLFDSWLYAKYSGNGVERVLEQYFGGSRLEEALTPVLISSYELERRSPFFFKSAKAKAGLAGYNFLMKHVARATSAAPTYFPPALVPNANVSGGSYALVDGGVFANNPALCAFAEARVMFPEAANMVMASLGTGYQTLPIRYQQARWWGRLDWMMKGRILDVVLSGVSDAVDYQLDQLLPAVDAVLYHHRIQTTLRLASDAMDDVSPQNLQRLREEAKQLIARKSAQLDQLCAQLTS